MTNCESIQNDLIFYLEDDLPQDKKLVVEKHFSNCRSCQFLLKELEKSLTIIDNEKQIEPSVDFFSKLSSKIDNIEKPVKRIEHKLLQVLSYAAVISIGIFIGSLTGVVLNNSSQQEPTQISQESIYWDDFMQEPIESFLITE